MCITASTRYPLGRLMAQQRRRRWRPRGVLQRHQHTSRPLCKEYEGGVCWGVGEGMANIHLGKGGGMKGVRANFLDPPPPQRKGIP